jgi:dienelactone hydrolase
MAHLSFQRVGLSIVTGLAAFVAGFIIRDLIIKSEVNVQLLSALPSISEKKPNNPYLPFRFDNLAKQTFTPQPLLVLDQLESTPQYNAFLIAWDVPNLDNQESKRVTGQLNIPTGNGPFPIIVMLRGYVEKEEYTTGVGTKNAAAALAKNGYITISPDFLGYGGSGPESDDVLTARFSKPVTVLQLLVNLQNPKLRKETVDLSSTENLDLVTARVFASDRIGIWAHSNGGQIALSLLEITGKSYPTTLWAPVSKPFPYSVLYFNDDLEDGGKYFRQALAYFENDLENNVEDFSILTHPENITAHIQLHQGGADEAVPLRWSQQLVKTLEEVKVKVTFFEYPQANHNLQPNWDQVVQRDIQFFGRELKK